MRSFYLFVTLLSAITVFSQETRRPFPKEIILKSNLLSLLAQRPTFSIEKVLPGNFTAEVSFVQGQFNHILFTDHVDYKGYLLRVKKHFSDIKPGSASLYGGLYLGTLKRRIYTAPGRFEIGNLYSSPGRDFSANSIRGGESLGCMYISKSRIVIDALISLGYGRYVKVYKTDSSHDPKAYLDAQVWLSVGYCF